MRVAARQPISADRVGVDRARAPQPRVSSGYINSLDRSDRSPWAAFRLASVARILYREGCLAPAPAVIWAGRMIRNSLPSDPIREQRLSEQTMLVQKQLQREYPRNGQCCRRRRSVGRRGKGQDRRLVVGAGRHRCALPGRPQCRPYPRDQRRNLQARTVAVGRVAAVEAVGDRQRRRGRSAGVPRRSCQTAGPGRRRRPGQSAYCRKRDADSAVAPRTRCTPGVFQRHHGDRDDAAWHRPGL